MKNVKCRMKNLRAATYRWLFILHSAFCILYSFQAHGERVTVEFKHPQILQKGNELASNILRIVNGTSKKINFYVGLNLPEGWSRVGENSNPPLYSVDAGDSLFVPIKLLFKGKKEGDISYSVVASLLAEATH